MNHYIQNIHQIEPTSRCNLKCVYCPSPKMKREKKDMEWDTFLQALEWVKYFRGKGTQKELSLTGIGEPLLHPRIIDMVAEVTAIMPDKRVIISTNGLLLTREICQQLVPYRPMIFVSTHRPEYAGKAAMMASMYGLLADVNTKFVTSSMNWAGQVDWYVSMPPMNCVYIPGGYGSVLVDGSITRCCMDAEGMGAMTTVFQTPNDKVLTGKFPLCDSCNMAVREVVNV